MTHMTMQVLADKAGLVGRHVGHSTPAYAQLHLARNRNFNLPDALPKMNRLFGAKSTAPKPTLNSAISNVCLTIPTSAIRG